ncbi:MAG: substrate-binding domain-containing protein [Cytophagales bacterium]
MGFLDYTDCRNLGQKISIFILAFVLFSCGNSDKPLDNATSGEINIACDYSFEPLTKALINVFESDYPRAKINLLVTTELNALRLLKIDSVQLIIVGSEPDTSLIAYFKNKKKRIEFTPLAYDGLALVTNPKSAYTKLNVNQLKGFLRDSINETKLVIDKGNSSNYNFLKNWMLPDSVKNQIFSATDFDEMVSYLLVSPNAIGVIGSSLISEDMNPKVQKYLNQIAVVSILNDSTGEETYPFPDYFARNVYPLERKINLVFNANYFGLAKGFASFAAGPKGQRIVLKFGLLPDRMPSRDLKIK